MHTLPPLLAHLWVLPGAHGSLMGAGYSSAPSQPNPELHPPGYRKKAGSSFWAHRSAAQADTPIRRLPSKKYGDLSTFPHLPPVHSLSSMNGPSGSQVAPRGPGAPLIMWKERERWTGSTLSQDPGSREESTEKQLQELLSPGGPGPTGPSVLIPSWPCRLVPPRAVSTRSDGGPCPGSAGESLPSEVNRCRPYSLNTRWSDDWTGQSARRGNTKTHPQRTQTRGHPPVTGQRALFQHLLGRGGP